MNNKKPRIFIGTREIADYYHRLYKELKKQGFKVGYYCYYIPTETSSLQDYENVLSKLTYILTKMRYKIIHKRHKKNQILDKIYLFFINLSIEIVSFFILIYSLFKYDVFILSFASSIIPYPYLIDLPLLKLFKKKVISCIFHGSEARPRYISMYGINREKPTTKDFKEVYKTVKIQKQKLKTIEKYSDIVIGSYLTSHFLKKKFVDYLHIGYISPEPKENIKENTSIQNTSDKISILHAPSKPELKGTIKIREAIEKLKQKYTNIEYIEITGKPNREVTKAIKECSFVVDQLYSDTPLAGLGTEAAISCKPTITAGYVWEELHRIYPKEMLAPSYLCDPSEIEEAIETLINNPKLREEIANKAYDFVLKNWSPKIISQKFISIIKNEIPERWFTEPIQNYAHFCLIEEQIGRKLLKQYISTFGDKALLLEDKPLLKKEFIKIANS